MTPGIPISSFSLPLWESFSLSFPLFLPPVLPLPRDICLSLLQKQSQHLILDEKPSVPAHLGLWHGKWHMARLSQSL